MAEQSKPGLLEMFEALALLAKAINDSDSIGSTLRVALDDTARFPVEFAIERLRNSGVPVLLFTRRNVFNSVLGGYEVAETWREPLGCQLPVGCRAGCRPRGDESPAQRLDSALALAQSLK